MVNDEDDNDNFYDGVACLFFQTGQDIVDIVDAVMAANESVLAETQKSSGTTSK